MALSAYFDELDARFPGGFDRGGPLDVGASAMNPRGVRSSCCSPRTGRSWAVGEWFAKPLNVRVLR